MSTWIIILIIIIIVLYAKLKIHEEKERKSYNVDPSQQYKVEEIETYLERNGYEIKKKKRSNWLVICIIAILAIYILTTISDDSSSKYDNFDSYTSTRTYSGNYSDKIDAYNYAEDFVKKKLKSPSSAKFPDSQQKVDDTTYESGSTYKINSYVESQNSFGAMIKTNFSCTIYFEDGNVFCKDLILY